MLEYMIETMKSKASGDTDVLTGALLRAIPFIAYSLPYERALLLTQVYDLFFIHMG